MKDSTIYSIGHGNKSIEQFVSELKKFDIKYVIDVRSIPYSKWNPQFKREVLKNELEENDIVYSFWGDSLGGRPKDKTCYNEEGKVVYEILKEKDYFKKSIERLVNANSKKIKIALMCSETQPEKCHRSKLIGQELLKRGVSLKHIIPDKEPKIKTQEEIILELTKGRGFKDIFGNTIGFTSRKSY